MGAWFLPYERDTEFKYFVHRKCWKCGTCFLDGGCCKHLLITPKERACVVMSGQMNRYSTNLKYIFTSLLMRLMETAKDIRPCVFHLKHMCAIHKAYIT
jgi:hypothetical protein